MSLTTEQIKERQKTVDVLCNRYDANKWSPEARQMMFKNLIRRVAKGYGYTTEGQFHNFMIYVADRFRKVNPIGYQTYRELNFLEGRKKAAITLRGRSTNPNYTRRDATSSPDAQEPTGYVDVANTLRLGRKSIDDKL